jgi:hypothetical protein
MQVLLLGREVDIPAEGANAERSSDCDPPGINGALGSSGATQCFGVSTPA